MKTVFVLFAFCLVGYAYADSKEDAAVLEKIGSSFECLKENGIDEVALLILLLDGESETSLLKKGAAEKGYGVLACIIKKLKNEGQTTKDLIADVVNADENMPADKKKELLANLDSCKTEAGDDDAKLLACLKVLEEPWSSVLLTDIE